MKYTCEKDTHFVFEKWNEEKKDFSFTSAAGSCFGRGPAAMQLLVHHLCYFHFPLVESGTDITVNPCL